MPRWLLVISNIVLALFFIYSAVQFVRFEERTAPPQLHQPLFGK